MSGIYSTSAGAQAVERHYRDLLGRWPVAGEHVRVPTARGETFVVASGSADAPALLLLHGSGANSAMWLGDMATWARHFRVYAVDMIGEPGLSAPARPPLASDAYACWLDDVLAGLGVARASIVGVSLGGWLALDYAVRRPGRVERLALLCPSGLGRQRWLPLLGALPLTLLGEGGRRRAMRRILGPAARVPPGGTVAEGLGEFALLVHRHFRSRRGKVPVFGDEALRGLDVPLLVVVGGRDALLDSYDTRRRLARLLPHADVRLLPEAGHLLPAQTREIQDFLEPAAGPGRETGAHDQAFGG
ncbi:alpha/beta fold hydrolase [Nonomuraea jiangxiensis]|uniref:Pimeloyl-ACP methyl ester carboxylesterase n=1 Tax=Nonomuraea jiangxiensis TaxID=633440 RepID=A0A1G7ZXN3_9ACTN|nr:alpha/beta hydrolase [Nonomuraea jiangxiensis]SDH13448.1 Pimeloyl-ACP methyl ester carboxylesterase [Nonomuraea jiangxiensis]